MSLRDEFVTLASQEGANIRELCRRYQISAKTGYKWLGRFRADGVGGLADRSRRPLASPARTPEPVEAAILALRAAHPTWGGRKLHHALRAQGMVQLADVPAPSTITAILARHGQLAPVAARVRPWRRFEHAAPNDLWQVDFMGHRPLAQGRVHPLTILDDHSRFALGLVACACERQEVVQAHLTACFRRYGLPHAILTDNGPPWGTSGAGGLTALEAWLLRLGIEPWHGRAYHPQTQGKVERFHRTIAAEAFGPHPFPNLAAAQTAFDAFRHGYNHDRPHVALADAVPLARYQASSRPFPETLPPIAYGPDDRVRRVRAQGAISFQNRSWFVGSGLVGFDVAVRPTTDDAVWAVVFCQREVARLDLRRRPEV